MEFKDHPNARSSHKLPTPRGGGISFVVISCFFTFVALITGSKFDVCGLPLLAAPLAFVGLIDDRYNLPSLWRYCFHIFTAISLLFFSPLLVLDISTSTFAFFLNCILILLAITAIINFTNFMDGLDGLVAGCMSVAFSSIILVLDLPPLMWTLVGSLLGFLFFNWSPARVFMGDVGSTFLGALFAGLLLHASSWLQAFGCLLVATPLLGDACLCVLRRFLTGQNVFQAHRLHLYQRLHMSGWSHAQVSLAYIVATSSLALAMLAGGWSWVLSLSVVVLLLGLWLDQRVAISFSVASKS